MFAEHPDLLAPEAETVLWRYMDLPRLLSLLEHHALWFARLDTLEDPYEGLPTRAVIDHLWSSPEGCTREEQARNLQVAEHNTRVFAEGRRFLSVSCWHASEIESTAMWSIYARLGVGIAVRSTFDRFRASLTDREPTVYGGLVRYVDFETHRPSSFNVFNWATLKRTSFAHEREFRALVIDEYQANGGLLVPFDLDRLVSAVYISPDAPDWYSDTVMRVCARYGLAARVHQSELLGHPAYLVERGQ